MSVDHIKFHLSRYFKKESHRGGTEARGRDFAVRMDKGEGC